MTQRAKKKGAKSRTAPKKAIKALTKRESGTQAQSVAANKKAHWSTFKDLHKQVTKAWVKLKSDLKKQASTQVLIQDKNHLLLLLGECNYMARECAQLAAKRKKQ